MTIAEVVSISSPFPGIDVTVSGSPGVTLTIYRLWSGNRIQLPGAIRVTPLSGYFYISDHSAPFGIPVIYEVTSFSALGAPLETIVSSPLTIDPGETWISDPNAPGVSTSIELRAGALAEINYSREVEYLTIADSDTPVTISGKAQQGSSIPMSMIGTISKCHEILEILRSTNPILVRQTGQSPGFTFIPPLAYCSSNNFSLVPYTDNDLAVVSWTVNLVAAPSTEVVVPIRVYSILPNEATYYSEQPLIYSNYLEMQRGY